jgi:hypothetical protein
LQEIKKLESSISKEDLDKIRNIDHPDFKSASIIEIEKEQWTRACIGKSVFANF